MVNYPYDANGATVLMGMCMVPSLNHAWSGMAPCLTGTCQKHGTNMILKHVDVSHMIWHVMPCHVSHTKTPHHMPFVVLFFVLELTLNVKEAVEDVGHAITKLASFLNLEVATNSHEPVENPQQQQ